MKPSQRRNPTHMERIKERQIFNAHFTRVWNEKSKVDNKTPRSYYLAPRSTHYQENRMLRSRSADGNLARSTPLSAMRRRITSAQKYSQSDLAPVQNLRGDNLSKRYERRFVEQDIMDRDFYNFATPMRPFEPRTLLTNFAQPKLLHSRNYQAPLKISTDLRQLHKNLDHQRDAAQNHQNKNQTHNTHHNHNPIPQNDRHQQHQQCSYAVLEQEQEPSNLFVPNGNAQNERFSPPAGFSATPTPLLANTYLNGRQRARPNLLHKAPSDRHNASKEDELKYYQMVSEVTEEIIARGVYSDRVLKSILANHIERRRHELSVAKMQRLLSKLLDDLGVSSVGLFSNYAEKASHPENVHFDINAKSDGYEQDRKQWRADMVLENGSRERTGEQFAADDFEQSTSVDYSKPKTEERTQNGQANGQQPLSDNDEDLSYSLNESDIDNLLEDRNIDNILSKRKGGALSSKEVENVAVGQSMASSSSRSSSSTSSSKRTQSSASASKTEERPSKASSNTSSSSSSSTSTISQASSVRASKPSTKSSKPSEEEEDDQTVGDEYDEEFDKDVSSTSENDEVVKHHEVVRAPEANRVVKASAVLKQEPLKPERDEIAITSLRRSELSPPREPSIEGSLADIVDDNIAEEYLSPPYSPAENVDESFDNSETNAYLTSVFEAPPALPDDLKALNVTTEGSPQLSQRSPGSADSALTEEIRQRREQFLKRFDNDRHGTFVKEELASDGFIGVDDIGHGLARPGGEDIEEQHYVDRQPRNGIERDVQEVEVPEEEEEEEHDEPEAIIESPLESAGEDAVQDPPFDASDRSDEHASDDVGADLLTKQPRDEQLNKQGEEDANYFPPLSPIADNQEGSIENGVVGDNRSLTGKHEIPPVPKPRRISNSSVG